MRLMAKRDSETLQFSMAPLTEKGFASYIPSSGAMMFLVPVSRATLVEMIAKATEMLAYLDEEGESDGNRTARISEGIG